MLNSNALSPDRLRVLAAVAEHGSMTAAARALAYTPSAVSQQISRLEADVGQPVLDRHARGARLTDAGRVIVEYAALLDRHLGALGSKLDDILGLRAGSLRLATFPTAGASLLPVAVKEFKTQNPDVELSVRSAHLAGLVKLLQVRSVELALLWEYDWSRIDDTGLMLRPLMRDPSRLVVSASHPLARKEAVKFADLGNERWIIRAEHHPVVDVLMRTARAAGFEPEVAFEAHDYQEAQAMVAVGLGVALVPSLALTSLRDDVRVVSLQPEAPARTILVGRLADRRFTPAEAALWELLADVGSKFASV